MPIRERRAAAMCPRPGHSPSAKQSRYDETDASEETHSADDKVQPAVGVDGVVDASLVEQVWSAMPETHLTFGLTTQQLARAPDIDCVSADHKERGC